MEGTAHDASYPNEDADVAVLADIVSGIETFSEAHRHAQIGEVRMLARAGQLAEKQSRGASERVKAHEMALRSIAAEIAGVVRVTDRTVQRRIDDARQIVEHYPRTLTAWEAGIIHRGHVSKIVAAGCSLPDEVRPAYEAAAVELCATDTPNRLESDLMILAQKLHPQTFAERHEAAAARRCVAVSPRSDGMSELSAVLPTVLADGIYDRLTQAANAIIDAGRASQAEAKDAAPHDFTDDTRRIDQVRADILADTLLTGAPTADPTTPDAVPGGLGAIRATVQVVIPVMSLLDAEDEAIELVGSSPIDAGTARVLAGCAPSLERILTHPIEGTVLEVDRYQPTAAMRRLLRGRDKHCRFPGCRMPAIRCELDHTVDAALGGATARGNLACLCQRHHSMKQFTPWRVRQLSGGVLEWTSPLGRTFREDAPRPLVSFAPAVPPDAAPAPF